VTDAPPVRRRLLGAALRRHRENAGYGLDDAARILECDRSKISRIETGQRGIRPKELRELLTEYGVDDARRDALVTIGRQTWQRGWWQSYAHVLDDAYQDYIILESTAAAIWSYEAQRIPGLLQTEDYARATAVASPFFESREQQDQFVEARLARQQILTRDNPPQFWAILSEAALRQLVGGPKVMQAQLRRLLELSNDLPSVTVQVLPFAAGAHPGSSGPFVILKFPAAADLGVVYLEGQTGGVYLEAEADVARYTLVYEHLRASALSTVATTQLISEVARELWQRNGTKSRQVRRPTRYSPSPYGARALTATTRETVSKRQLSGQSDGRSPATAAPRGTASRLRRASQMLWQCATRRTLTGRR
jgi:transcriptional regulator with XRE-family HTH domain